VLGSHRTVDIIFYAPLSLLNFDIGCRAILSASAIKEYMSSELNEERKSGSSSTSSSSKISRPISISDCFSIFLSTEQLTKENTVFCSVCKKQQEVLRKSVFFFS
jgi:hypothetical protein